MACSSRRFLMDTEGRKVPSGNVTPNHSVPSTWVTGVALVNGPSTETLTLPFCPRKSRCQRLEAGQTGAYSLPARPRQTASIYGESDSLPSKRELIFLPPMYQT